MTTARVLARNATAALLVVVIVGCSNDSSPVADQAAFCAPVRQVQAWARDNPPMGPANSSGSYAPDAVYRWAEAMRQSGEALQQMSDHATGATRDTLREMAKYRFWVSESNFDEAKTHKMMLDTSDYMVPVFDEPDAVAVVRDVCGSVDDDDLPWDHVYLAEPD